MKTLLVLLISNCLLVPLASGQSFAQQLRDKMGHSNEQLHKHSSDDRAAQNQFSASPQSSQQQQDGQPTDRRKASDLARGAYPGRVLSIRPEGPNWRVRMDKGGTVFNVIVDPEKGSVVRPSK